MRVEIWTDGSATTKDKPGGYAWVITVNGEFHSEGSGHLVNATNNDAELAAALSGLDEAMQLYLTVCYGTSFPQDHEFILKSDSELIIGWANGSYKFKQVDKLPLYESLRRLMKKLNVKTEWVKAHSGIKFNERCDELANQARLGIQKQNEKIEAKNTGNSLIGTKKDDILCVWHNEKLKIIDLDNLIVEVYDRQIHGKRGSMLEIRKDRLR